jgi:signal transduction histidine kinase
MVQSWWRPTVVRFKPDNHLIRESPSVFGVFIATLVFRWSTLALACFIYYQGAYAPYVNVSSFWILFPLLIAYNAALTIWSKQVADFHERSAAFFLFDMTLSFIALTMTSSWGSPFWLYTLSTLIFPALYGRISIALFAAFFWSVLTQISLNLNGFTIEKIASLNELDSYFAHFLDYFVVALLLGYTCKLLRLLRESNTMLQEREKDLREANRALNQRHQEIFSIQKISKAILSHVELPQVIKLILRSLEQLGFKKALIGLVDGGAVSKWYGSKGVSPQIYQGLSIPLNRQSLVGLLLIERKSLNLASLKEVVPDAQVLLGFKVPGPLALLPLVSGEKILGVLMVMSQTNKAISPDEMRLLELFVDQTSIALHHAQLLEAARSLGIAEERNRLAIELHDTVLQNLYASRYLLSSAMKEENVSKIKKQLRYIDEALFSSLRELRFALLDWESFEWDGDFEDTVKRFLKEFERFSKIKSEFQLRGQPRKVPFEKAKTFLRVLQESLSNVWRHASADRVEVELAFTLKGVRLKVQDNGVGFKVREEELGFGLKHVRSRIKEVKGRFKLKSSLDNGTVVEVWIPV